MENLILDDCSEAEYLDDRCDYNFDNLDTYSSEEKQLYVIARITQEMADIEYFINNYTE